MQWIAWGLHRNRTKMGMWELCCLGHWSSMLALRDLLFVLLLYEQIEGAYISISLRWVDNSWPCCQHRSLSPFSFLKYYRKRRDCTWYLVVSWQVKLQIKKPGSDFCFYIKILTLILKNGRMIFQLSAVVQCTFCWIISKGFRKHAGSWEVALPHWWKRCTEDNFNSEMFCSFHKL